jgi:hypothetical protein
MSRVRVTIDGMWIGFMDHLQVVTANNYNTITDFLILQISHAKPSPACSVFTRRFLAMASNSGGCNRLRTLACVCVCATVNCEV